MGQKKKGDDVDASTPKEKVVRSDVKLRKEANKDTEFTCIKGSWKYFCKNSLLADTIVEDILPKVNVINFLSYKLINFHYTRLLEEGKPLPDLKQNLFYQACCMVSQLKYTKGKEDTTTELYESFSQMKEFLTDELPERDYIAVGYIQNLNLMQMTNSTNHLKLNFYNRFRKYLKLRTGETRNAVVYGWLKDIYEPVYEGTVQRNEPVHSADAGMVGIPTHRSEHQETRIAFHQDLLCDFERV